MKKWQKFLALSSVSILAVASLTACGGSKSGSSDKKDGTTELLMYQVGDKPENYDVLMKNANKIIKEKTGVTVNLQYISWGEWDKKMSTIVASGENYDISLAQNYVSDANKGAYADLTELLPKYAKAAYEDLDTAYIKGNTLDGKLYAMPVNGNVYSKQVLTFNKQYLDKYNLSIDDVNSYESAEKVLKAFHEKEPNIPAFAIGSGFNATTDGYDYPMGKDQPFAVDVRDPDKIINPYEQSDVMATLKTMNKFFKEGLTPKDVATSTQSYPLEGNTWFVREETQGPMDYGDTILTNAAGQPLVSKAITAPLKSTGNAQMANFVVAKVSKNKEKAAEVLGVINSDPELLNGLVYGVKGEAWELTADNKVKLLDGYKPNYHMAAWNTGNNKILYVQDTITDEQIKERDESIATAEESPILGFNFKTDKVKSQITNIANVQNRYQAIINTGSADPEVEVPKLLADLKKAGWDEVQKEMQAQYEAFRKGN
ncbi:putative ABC transporter substrate binding lipoprotein [Lactococcus hodotermopsidis]|uniref:Putative ABC transporter substrate binding lipoprotein n=1 Tax=Pseudolactococcus hodotermopsidis TaxID=2709157 RepID=A0A6A0BDC2_9LACT|nr:ABC transporter substrate-binding protein [Lactococcus hodotermopsidis]GFH42693.1 putative ABC transporter substrate binding lipoprotein [Lactococcus hodotermopsidis]